MALRAPLPGHWSTSKQVVVFFALNWPALWALHLGNLILGMAAGLVGVVQYKATFAVFADANATTTAKIGIMEASVLLGFAASATLSAFLIPVMTAAALAVVRADADGKASFSFTAVMGRSLELYKSSWLTLVRVGPPLVIGLVLLTAMQALVLSSPDPSGSDAVFVIMIILAYLAVAVVFGLAAFWGLQLILAPCYCMDGYTAHESLDQSRGAMKGHISWMYRVNLVVYGMIVLPVLVMFLILIFTFGLPALWVLVPALLAVMPAQFLVVPFAYNLIVSTNEDAQLFSELSSGDEV